MLDLRAATEADLPEVVALSNLAFRGAPGQAQSWNIETFIEGQRTDEATLRGDLAANPDARLLVWQDDDGALLGHVWLEPDSDGAWYLGLLTVRPDRQDQQLGRRLLSAAEDQARGLGADRIRMTVIQLREGLIAWYLRRGYRLTGETKPFPYGDERFGRPTRDDLHFVVLERSLQGVA